MANKWHLSAELVGIEQVANPGFSLTGDAPLPASLPAKANKARQVYEIAHHTSSPLTPTNGGGLFCFDEWLRLGGKHVYVRSVLIVTDDSNVTWSVKLTDGMRKGSAVQLDDPAFDIELESGTGAAVLDLKQELLPLNCIRVTTGTNGGPGIFRVILLVALTTSEMGMRP